MQSQPTRQPRDPVVVPLYVLSALVVAFNVALYFFSVPLGFVVTLLLPLLLPIDGMEAQATWSAPLPPPPPPQLDQWLGARGRTTTALRPHGIVAIGDERLDAFADDGYLDEATQVEVVGVIPGRVVVRAAGDS